METLTNVEREALNWLLAGDIPGLDVLREQAIETNAEFRETSHHGFYTSLWVDPRAPILQDISLTLSDVMAEVPGLRGPLGFVLFVDAGVLKMLEGYAIDDKWPDAMAGSRFYYEHGVAALSPVLLRRSEALTQANRTIDRRF
jgi:hypothetical protein